MDILNRRYRVYSFYGTEPKLRETDTVAWDGELHFSGFGFISIVRKLHP